MAEDDCEIEYLDEDEELVQNYVHNVSVPPAPIAVPPETPDANLSEEIPYLVERRQPEKRKKIEEDDDNDYDPSEERKKKRPMSKKTPKIVTHLKPSNITLVPRKLDPEARKATITITPKKSLTPVDEVLERKKTNIRMEDFEDALCLPVRAIKHDEYDLRRLKQWNHTCLERFAKIDGLLHPEKGSTVSSSRTIVFKNLMNKNTNRVETSIWSKCIVKNKKNSQRSEAFHGVLPRFREKKVVTPFSMRPNAKSENHRNKYEVLLTKEDFKGEDFLVAYNVESAISAIYKEDKSVRADNDNDDDEPQMMLKEATCCKMCAPCYQASWRGVKTDNKSKNVKCKICQRSFVSVYNLLAHLKSHHSSDDVRGIAGHVSSLLAGVVGYHYKCRICQKKCPSVKDLRSHVSTHQGSKVFKCEVGNHMAS